MMLQSEINTADELIRNLGGGVPWDAWWVVRNSIHSMTIVGRFCIGSCWMVESSQILCENSISLVHIGWYWLMTHDCQCCFITHICFSCLFYALLRDCRLENKLAFDREITGNSFETVCVPLPSPCQTANICLPSAKMEGTAHLMLGKPLMEQPLTVVAILSLKSKHECLNFASSLYFSTFTYCTNPKTSP